jgi:hypothetical protein
MRRLIFTVAGLGLAHLALSLSLALASDPDKSTKPDGPTCGSFGTKVDFFDTPSQAARQAQKEEKLVFVLHVSGNFEDPRFT